MAKPRKNKRNYSTREVEVNLKSNDDLQKSTGSLSVDVQKRLVSQVCETAWVPNDIDDKELVKRIEIIVSMLQSIEPANEMEGMLAAQMVAVHHAAMECLRRSVIRDQPFKGRDMNLKHATKLLALFSRQLQTLDKHRGKGQQKVTVEHVNVEYGGKAVVGNIERSKSK